MLNCEINVKCFFPNCIAQNQQKSIQRKHSVTVKEAGRFYLWLRFLCKCFTFKSVVQPIGCEVYIFGHREM